MTAYILSSLKQTERKDVRLCHLSFFSNEILFCGGKSKKSFGSLQTAGRDLFPCFPFKFILFISFTDFNLQRKIFSLLTSYHTAVPFKLYKTEILPFALRQINLETNLENTILNIPAYMCNSKLLDHVQIE